ncbi:MAG: ANTAR domain-containing protein [Actinomycetota bacterium]|nr:ANTAR domain-containing protein [Actinomycetota bacterium]
MNACTVEEAFALLVERSQRGNVKLRHIARRVLDELTRTTP